MKRAHSCLSPSLEKKCPTVEVIADPTTQDMAQMLVQRLDKLQASIDALHQVLLDIADCEDDSEAVVVSKTKY